MSVMGISKDLSLICFVLILQAICCCCSSSSLFFFCGDSATLFLLFFFSMPFNARNDRPVTVNQIWAHSRSSSRFVIRVCCCRCKICCCFVSVLFDTLTRQSIIKAKVGKKKELTRRQFYSLLGSIRMSKVKENWWMIVVVSYYCSSSNKKHGSNEVWMVMKEIKHWKNVLEKGENSWRVSLLRNFFFRKPIALVINVTKRNKNKSWKN